ncbi:hypothetical protein Krac_8330 [Ktedonobacter racemifer DSM 44963]|uniref:FG-GAP repeat protein n=1 Tax=Ktedonobacter racemifer DSM 44963 TaxID=485913 RepID=D6TMK9_KTERA|nr:hypothetical protein Krac_8330 [Ktedonobacter racemifer DSM 44963]
MTSTFVLVYYVDHKALEQKFVSLALGEDGTNVEQSYTARGGRMSAKGSQHAREQQVASRDFFDDEYDDELPGRMPKSVRRYHSDVKSETGRVPADVQASSQSVRLASTGKVPPRRTAVTQGRTPAVSTGRRHVVDTEDVLGPGKGPLLRGTSLSGRHPHLLVYIGLLLVVMVLGWFALTFLSNWWQVTQDDWHYGRPRTSQIDYVVGHNNDSSAQPSHFMALNMNRKIEIIECPASDCSKAKIYIGPDLIGPNQDLTPATLSFSDENGDGKPDMIVHIQDTQIIFINENGAFRPQRPNENLQAK